MLRRGRGRRGRALYGVARLAMRRCGWRSSPNRGGASSSSSGREWGALGGRRTRLRHGTTSCRLKDSVGADRRGRWRRTVDSWLDKRRQTESVNEADHRSDGKLNFTDVLLAIYSTVFAQICPNRKSYMSSIGFI